jgi:hypothetical protein
MGEMDWVMEKGSGEMVWYFTLGTWKAVMRH